MPYGYGASQAYHDRAVRSSPPPDNNWSDPNPVQISTDLDQLLQQANQVPSTSITQQDQGGGGHPGGWIDEPSDTFSPPPNIVSVQYPPLDLTPDEPIKSTGLGPDDLKAQDRQNRAREEKENYIKKLIALASSGMSSPGPLMHGLDFSFGGRKDPTIDTDLYNTDMFSGDVPVSDFQKALFLAQHDIGRNTKIFYDEDGNLVSPTDDYFSGKEGIAGLGRVVTDEETGKTSFKKTGLGQHILGDVWNTALDPGGLYPSMNPYWSGDIMADWFKQGYEGYSAPWNSWEDPWWGGHYQGQVGEVDSLSDLARRTWFSESLSDVEAREQKRMDEGLGVATMTDMERMYDMDFAAKANPLFDPGFSFGATEQYDPLYGDLKLWQQAQET